jgi:LemA protein
MSILLIAGFGVLALIIVAVLVYYINRIRILSNRIENAWAQIDVQLKKRTDLVPNLVEAVKGYMKHERRVFENVTKARSALLGAQGPDGKAAANNQLTTALKTLFAVSENYPKLRANENFLMLQEELSGIENKIAYSRQFYNDSVLTYNNLITTIPGSFFAGSRKPKNYFEVEAAERAPVKVKFE